MTFRRLAPNTLAAETFEVARRRALALYREWLREVPRLIAKYPLDIPSSLGRARVRAEFERFRSVADLGLTNVLLLKGTMELIEAHNKWKQKTHVMRYFDSNDWDPDCQLRAQKLMTPLESKASPFLASFLEQGRK